MPIIYVTCVQAKIVSRTTIVLHHRQMCSIAITLYPMIIVRPVEEPRGSMFLFKRRHKWRLTEKSFDRIPTRWRLVIAGLIGSGTGLLILTMWAPGSAGDKSLVSNQSFQLTSRVQLDGRMMRIQSFDYEKSPDYCEKEACSTVTCSTIPESLDPGQIASDYITGIFKARCPGTNAVKKLIFGFCTFPNKTLKRNWLNTSLPIDELSFSNCALADLTKGAFASSVFDNLKILTIETTEIKSLNKWIFQELSNLNQLHVIKNIIHEAQYDLLQPVANSLEVLALDDCFTDFQVLSNITGDSSLLRVQIASIQRNSIGTLSSKILKSIPNVVSLFLVDSRIESCEVDAFGTTRSLELLDMSNNLLKNLPSGIFASLTDKKNVRLSIQENPWECTCQFRWIQDTIRNHPSIFAPEPKCQSPEVNAGLDFLNANFCDETGTAIGSSPTTSASRTTETPTTQDHPIENEDEGLKFLSFTCKNRGSPEPERVTGRKLFSTNEWKFPSRFQHFFAKPLDDGTVLVNLEMLTSDVSLIWFPSPDNENLTTTSISCVGNVRGPYLLTNLERGRSYTVCLLEEPDKAPSPFDCLATRTEPLPWSDTWLTYEDKAIVVSVSITMIIIVSIVSVLSSFLVIRRNPSLLRGSKRIVMVRNRGVEALVLPQGIAKDRTNVKDNSMQKRFVDDPQDYLTPLEVGRCAGDSSPRGSARKDSKASGVSSQYSAGSYVSAVEPSPTELADWRNNGKVRSSVSCLEDEEPEKPPPVPPHRRQRHVIPSLSLSVEALRKDSLTFRIDGRDVDDNKTVVQWID